MNRFSRYFVLMAIAYAVLGMLLGIGMGMHEDYTHTPLHAHINLVGWTTMALFGVVYQVFPALSQSRLAAPHFWLMTIGTPLMLAGIPMAHSGGNKLPAIAGSFAVLAAMALFLVLFARRGKA